MLKNRRLKELHALRIVYAHDTELPPPDSRRSNPDTLKLAADTMRRLVSASHIERSDADGWARLQLAILREVQSILINLRDACRTAADSTPSAKAPGTEFVWKD